MIEDHLRTELVPRRLRTAFREQLVGEPLGFIDDLFQSEGLIPGDEPPASMSGQRRRLVECYYNSVNWKSPSEVARVLRVFESVLARYREQPEVYGRLSKALELDGFRLSQEGRITSPFVQITLPEGALASVKDSSAILMHLDRIAKSAHSDPEQAIGAAKELIESTAKVLLETLGCEVAPNADLPSLIREAQKVLALHPDSVAPDRRGADSIKRILGALSTVAIGIDELRNIYGTGHGKVSRVSGIGPRHVDLAVGAAVLYCRFLLETLDDPVAPWAKNRVLPS